MSLKILLIVNLWIILNLYLMIKRIWVLIYIRSGLKTPQESYLDKSILTQSEISLIYLWISETKIDNSFSISQFTMTGYSIPFRLDRTSHGGGILLFVREDIPCKIIKTDCDADFEGIFVEINLRKKKWLLCCSYNPHKSNIANHLKKICKTLDKLNSTYDNLVL